MTAATRLIHTLAGSPDVPGVAGGLLEDVAADCCICAQPSIRTAPTDRALGANFSDRGHLRHHGSARVCAACLWCCSGRPPATLRMWSIVATPGRTAAPSQPKAWVQAPGLCLTNRADTRPIIDMLANPPSGPWVVTVAISGQKHVVPYADVNHGSGSWRVRVEDHDVSSTPQEWAAVHGLALELRRLGVPADAVLSGDPQFAVKGGPTRDLLTRWAALAPRLQPYLGSPLLRLALWTITRPIIEGDRP